MKTNFVGDDVRSLTSCSAQHDGSGRNQSLLTSAPTRGELAFSLLEVMLACAIFFMATFAILALTSRTIAQARSLQPVQVDPASVAAELSLTNKLEEGPIPPDLIAHFEHMYPNYTCGGMITEVGTNGLFQVDLEVGGLSAGKHVITSTMRLLLFRPMSTPNNQRMPTRNGLR